MRIKNFLKNHWGKIASFLIPVAFAGGVLTLSDKQIVDPPIDSTIASISFNGQQIDFTYTDENVGENLLLYTDLESYNSWDSSPSYFAAKNITKKDQNFQFQCFFAGTEQCQNVQEFKPQVPYEIDVLDYADKETCEERTDSFKKAETVCYKKQIGTHKETRYRDEWGTVNQKAVENLDAKDTKKIAKLSAKDQFEFWIPSGQTKYFRTLLTFPAGRLGEKKSGKFALKAIGHLGAYGSLDPSWYSGSWGYRVAVTIDHTKASSTLTNFPFLFNTGTTSPPTYLKYTGSGGHVGKSDGTDILFTSSDGTTKLNHELEKYSSSTGETIAWVQVPTMDGTTDTVIYMYYGNSGASDQQNITGTWDSSYKGVWHFPNGTTLTANDSTSNATNGTQNGPTYAITGVIDGGLGENNSGQHISTSFATNTTTITSSGWMYTAATNQAWLVAKGWDGSTTNFEFGIAGAGGSGVNLRWAGYSAGFRGIQTSTGSITTNAWHYIVGTYDGTNWNLYIDGAFSQATAGSAPPSGNTGTVDIGSTPWNGNIDEVRLSWTSRTSAWILTEYNNQNSPSTFYSVGAEESAPSGAITQGTRMSIIGNNSGFSSDSPQLINQTTIADSLTSSTTLAIAQPKAGNTLILTIGLSSISTTVTGVTGGGATWTRALSSATNRDVETWYGMSNGTSNSVTVTYSNASSASSGNISEWSGIASSNPVAQTATSSGNSVQLITGNVTNTTPNVLILAHTRSATGTASGTPTNNFVPLTTPNSGTWAGAYRLPNANSTYSTTWELTVAKIYDTNILVFLPASKNTRVNINNGRVNINN